MNAEQLKALQAPIKETGGSGLQACSGDMLLEALVACAGVTLKAVATALGIHLKDAKLSAEGDLDFRVELTERYCVVMQTIRGAPPVVVSR